MPCDFYFMQFCFSVYCHCCKNKIYLSITIGLDIPTMSSVQKPRWNFWKRNWPEFTKNVAESINRMSPRSGNYQRLRKLVITKAKLVITKAKKYPSPRPRNIETSHAGQMKARPYSKSKNIMGIPIPTRSS